MKFTDGYWHMKSGITTNIATEIRDIKTEDSKLTIFVACKKVTNRGDTLNAPIITIEYTSPMENIIGVKAVHFKGVYNKGPEFELNHEKANVNVGENEDYAFLKSGELEVRVGKKSDFSVDYYFKGKRITGSGYKTTLHAVAEDRPYMREQLDLGVGEYVYGLGERFTPFVKNGQVVDIWNEDGGTCSEQAYKNIPFYVTNKNYGILVNDPGKVSFEVASENVEKVQFSVPGESLEYFILGGDTPKGVLEKYTQLTGKPAMPPAWSFGLWLTTSFTTSYDEDTVNSFVNGMLERNIPLNVFHFDCFWMKEYQWCDFKWDEDVFTDPKAMLDRLKAKGLKICVWINSYIAQKSYLFDEGMKNGYLVKKSNGDVWQWDRWQDGMSLVDFTNPAACEWYKGKLKELLEMGVDCFKTDFGERIPTDVVYFDGSDPEKMHNYYTYLYNKTVFEAVQEVKGKDKALLFARSATVGGQKFPVHWGGDCSATYESMAETIRGGLSACLSGIGFWSHDISGFESTATPDIYKRWCAFGLLSTHSRLHGSKSYRVPWLFDEESVDVLRFFTNLKCTLMPYIYAQAKNAVATGVPVMRAMVLEFPEDYTCHTLDRQYMLGDSLLVAPILNKEGNGIYYLPEGTWTNLISGETKTGGKWYDEYYDYMSMPLFVKPNSIIAVGNVNDRPDYDYLHDLEFNVYELADSAECTVFNEEGNRASIKLTRKDNSIQVIAENLAEYKVILKNTLGATSVSKGEFEAIDGDTVITLKANEAIINFD